MSLAWQVRLWYAQRVSAAVLAACVLVHLATMLFAVRGGLDAAEILSRTRGNGLVAAFYIVFVVAAAVHAPIGLGRVLEELGPRALQGRTLWLAMAALAAFVAVTGLAAVAGLAG